jgi:hypothetical protein
MEAIRKRYRDSRDEEALLWLRQDAAKLSRADAWKALKALNAVAVDEYGCAKYQQVDSAEDRASVAALQKKLLDAGFGASPAPGLDVAAPTLGNGVGADLPDSKRRR